MTNSHSILQIRWALPLLVAAILGCQSTAPTPEQEVESLLNQDTDYVVVSEPLFDRLGWALPDDGKWVKTIADAAPFGAFDPRELEALSTGEIGYRARWQVHRFSHYNLDWDITGLHLTPNSPEEGVPTLVIINGGSANWYEFFVDPLNNPGIGQYLAQRVPVLLVTIPGNYKEGGWIRANQDRAPQYLLDTDLSEPEVKVRNAVFTFELIAEGLRSFLEANTVGPLLIVGHSTGGELQFMLKNSSLRPRLQDLSLGWGTGPPGPIKKSFDDGTVGAPELAALRILLSETPGQFGDEVPRGMSREATWVP